MDIYTLCERIELQPLIKNRVFAFAEKYHFQEVDKYQKEYLSYKNMERALAQTREALGEDVDGIKILACMLKASADIYEIYRQKGISDEIYIMTMKCFPRFINETYQMTGELSFDRYWWTTRQAGGHLFRIGALEYEIKELQQACVISIHIPSDADFSPSSVEASLHDANIFFEMYFPALSDVEYRCHSWLLDGQLRKMLRENSNIMHFQNRFEIYDQGEPNTEFVEWLYHVKLTDYHSLPENTSLQINVKKHLIM